LGDTTRRDGGANQMGDNLPAVNLGAGRTAQQVGIGQTTAAATTPTRWATRCPL
jgi:hypothetical protein